jgi:DNA-binding MarR family transcriptional regulator
MMKIEEEIKQKRFKSEYQKAVINILFTSSWLSSANSKALKPYGITPQQYNILRILRGQFPNPVTVSLLQERMLDRMSNASRLVEKLKVKKLVERKECKKDRRQVDVLLTEIGLGLLKEIDLNIKDFENILDDISSEEAEELNRILDKIRG